ncbi:MAG TPA: ribonuclease P protein component [Longimicrobiales bacterium]|nr:ribonuclease P protein component [Longimicrobiales bacterium]
MEGPGSREPERPRLRLARIRRITGGDAIRALVRRGKRSKTAHLDVFASASPAVRSRVAIVVPKHGHEIVARNRLKRRLREIVRTELLPRLDGAAAVEDVLVRARAEAYRARFADLREELVHWIDRRWPDASRSR